MPLFSKKIITGCEEGEFPGVPYMTRYTILKTRAGSLYLHVFHRSDERILHDHPWNFASLILWRGYYEVALHECRCYATDEAWNEYESRRKWPGMLLFRRATWAHRVVLVNEKPAVSLVWVSHRVRTWGFFTKSGWKDWKTYFHDRGCKTE